MTHGPETWENFPVVARMAMPTDLHRRSKDGYLLVVDHGTDRYSVVQVDPVPVSFTRDEWHTTATHAEKAPAADAFDIFATVVGKRWERLIND